MEEVSELSATAVTCAISSPLTVNAPFRFRTNIFAVELFSSSHHFPVSGLSRLAFLLLLMINWCPLFLVETRSGECVTMPELHPSYVALILFNVLWIHSCAKNTQFNRTSRAENNSVLLRCKGTFQGGILWETSVDGGFRPTAVHYSLFLSEGVTKCSHVRLFLLKLTFPFSSFFLFRALTKPPVHLFFHHHVTDVIISISLTWGFSWLCDHKKEHLVGKNIFDVMFA